MSRWLSSFSRGRGVRINPGGADQVATLGEIGQEPEGVDQNAQDTHCKKHVSVAGATWSRFEQCRDLPESSFADPQTAGGQWQGVGDKRTDARDHVAGG